MKQLGKYVTHKEMNKAKKVDKKEDMKMIKSAMNKGMKRR